MKSSYLIIGCMLLLACAVMPVQAFSAKSLAITFDANGNAQVHFTYEPLFHRTDRRICQYCKPGQ